MKSSTLLVVVLFFLGLTQSVFAQNNGPRVSPSGPLILCPNSTIILTVQNSPTGATFQWQRNGNDIKDSTRSSLVVNSSGEYTVFLNGDKNSLNTVTITAGSAPVADFSFSPNSTCGISTIRFTNNSTGAASYTWNFGNGRSSDQTNPSHRYRPNPGTSTDTYQVTLTAVAANGCTSSNTQSVTIGQRPDATLTGNELTTINGDQFFKICQSVAYPFTVINASQTANTNSRYVIDWGDGTPAYDSDAFGTPLSHTYGVGQKNLTFKVYRGQCIDSTVYKVFVGNIPAGGIAGIGGSTICTGSAQQFRIVNAASNPEGTMYVINYSDTLVNDTFYHPAPDTISHSFRKSSCNVSSSNGNLNFPNSFGAYLTITNPCGLAGGSILPIYVSDKPESNFDILPGDSVCINQTVKIQNKLLNQRGVENGTCVPGKFVWKIESSNGLSTWNFTSGTTGTTNSSENPVSWVSGSNFIDINFTQAGEYKITLVSKNNNNCGADTMIKTICVNPLPTASFTTDVSEGCAPLKVKATGTTNQASCGNNIFSWSVFYVPIDTCAPAFASYNLLNGTTLNSPSPEFEFINPGKYTIRLQVLAPGGNCISTLVEKVITVKGVPVVTIPAIPDFCQDKSIAPTMTATCFTDASTTYSWTFPDGTPSTSSLKIPGNVFFTTPGTKTITASATNVCGTGTVNLNINVLALPTVAVINGPDQVCVGSTIQLTNATTGGTWASLQPTIATVDANGNVRGLSEGTAEITYTVTSAGCSRVVTKTITVNPNPILTVPGRQDICIGNSVDLTISGNASTYSWSPATGLNTTSGTNVTASPTTTQKYIITATNSTTGCVKKDSITVNVNQQPNLLVNSPTICAGGSANLTATGAVTYTWSPSTGLLTTTGAQVVATPTQTQIYTVIGTSGVGCTDTAQSTVTVNPRPVVSVNSGTICAGSSITLTAQGADSYTWAVPGGSVLTGSSVSVSPLVTSTIRVTGSNQTTNCSNVADALVTVNPLPNVTVNSPTICPGDSAILIAAGADIFSWTPSTDLNTNVGSTVVSKPTGNITYTVRGTNNQTTCFREVNAVVTVRAIPNIQVESTNPTTCNGTTGAIRITGLVPNTSYTAFYTLLNAERSFAGSSNASGVLTITGLVSGTYSNIYISQFSCVSNAIASITLTDPQPPVQPIISEVNPICSGNDLTLSISNGITNGSYIWTGPNGFNQSTTLTSVVLPNVQVASAGVYNVIAVQNACSSTNASVSVVVNPTPLAPTVANLTFCQLDQTNELVAGIAPTNQALWYTLAQGGTSSTQAPTPSTSQTGSTTYYVSQKSPEGCESPRAPLNVLVNTTPNIGAQTVELCTDVPLSFIPTNAPANTLYTWSLPNIAIPGSITGATAQSTPVASINQLLTNTTLASASAIYTIANATGSCKGPDFELTVNLNPTPLILDKMLDPICSGETFTFTPAQGILGERLPTGTRLSWTIASISPANAVTGAGASVAPQTSLIQTLVNQTNQVATVTYTVTPYLNDCAGKPFSVSIQVNPRPLLPNLNETICSEQTVNPIFQNSPPSRLLPQGTLFTWTLPQVVGNNPNAISGFTAQASGVTSFTQTLVNNTSSPQRLIYTVSSIAGTCAGPNFTIEVLVNPKPNLTNFSDTICSGTSFVLPTNAAPVGTTYTWGLPVVIGAGNVSGIAAQTTPVTTVSQRLSSDQILPVKVLYNIVPTTGNCGGSGFPLEVIVNPTPFLPTLRDTICTAFSFDVIPSNGVSGSIVPAGTTYTWDLPTSVIPGLVTGGAAQQVQQPNISQQLFNSSDAPVGMIYKVTPRSGSFGNCVGPLFDVIVTVNPDARAVISPIDTIGCAPFVIDNNRVRLQQRPSANADYNWFIDGSLIGSGVVFPGFTMRSPDDTILLKLLTTSLHGCKPDSTFRRFYTYKVPSPSFAVSDTVGCGPLNVVITNNTPFKELFTYRWSFGNGITSFQADPPLVTYLPNPSFGDTIYIMKLDVNSICGTYSTETRIRVKSRPKALFTPSSTVGCSPMKVTFNNTSRGLNNRYVWNFGDGRIDSTTTLGLFEHTFITAVRDTFTVKLYAINECGIDSSSYDIIVSPNTIKLDYAVNGTQKEGCVTHRVDFINNTIGASLFRWDFGDGNVRSTTKNIDTVSHTYLQPGTYNVKLFATNGCSDTTATEQIIVYGLPTAEFLLSRTTACIGDSIFMLNRSQGADTYLWKFGDGRTSTAVNPGHRFSQSGDKEITLIAYKSNAPGIVCVDSIVRTVSITDSVNINFNYSDSIANCAPLTVTFKNLYPGNTFAAWDFGDGRRQNGDSVSNTYTIPGNYLVTLNVKTTNGCNYYGSKPIVIRSPFGTVRYKSNYSCIDETLRFEALPENTDSIRWNFGDGTTFTTTERVVFYKYKLPGTYLPKVEFVSSAGCSYLPPIRDSIRIDRVNAGFKSVREEICGSTKVIFTDTSTTYFPRSAIRWNFGDGTVGNNAIQEINYRSSNTFIITNIVTSVSGCSDTAVTVLPVFVKGIPSAQVIGDTAGCTNRSVRLESKILSSDSISLIRWRTAQNTDVYGSVFTAQYGVSGSYPLTLIVGTKFGCYDTVSVPLTVYTAPNVVASADVTICSGSSIELNATGADRYSWFPIQDISCVNCQTTIAKPQQSTIFSVRGESINGCFDLDTVLVTVIPKFKMKATPSDSICIGDSIQLVVSGAASYKWTPSSTLSGDTIQNPIAKPERTTTYRIVGSDEYGCFKDTAFITIGVGNYPTLNLGEDLLLPTGALFTVKPTFTEGPMKSWKWTPAKDLNCVDCPNPTIRARNGITYVAQATNFFGCSATDSITIRVFCENSQVFIPNAFTPDNDGINDLFIVRASGIQSVKSLKIFNRWGQMVFDRANFEPNDPKNAWDGRVNGIVGGPDVYVYIIEVICDDGTPYFYKGNVSILK